MKSKDWSKFEKSIIIFTWTTVPHVFRLKWRLMWVPLEMPRQEVLDRKSSSPPTRSLGIETAMELGSHCTGTAHKTNVEVKSSNPDRKRNKVVEKGSDHLDRSVCHLPRSDPGDNDSNMIRPLRSIHGCSPHSHCHSQQYLHNHKNHNAWVKWKPAHIQDALVYHVLTFTALPVLVQYFSWSTLTSMRALGVDAYFCTSSITFLTFIHILTQQIIVKKRNILGNEE